MSAALSAANWTYRQFGAARLATRPLRDERLVSARQACLNNDLGQVLIISERELEDVATAFSDLPWYPVRI